MKYTNVPQLASRLREISPSATLTLAQKAREMADAGTDVVSLTAGEPDFRPAPHILAALQEAIAAGHTRYTAVNGIPELRDAIARRYRALDGLEYEQNELIVSSGAKQSLYNAVQCLIEPGTEAVMIGPYWLSYRDMTVLAGGTPVVVEAEEASGYTADPAKLDAAINAKTRLLFLNSPSNPTGAAYSAFQLKAIADVLRRHPQVTVISDEIYRRFVYDNAAETSLLRVAPDLQDRTIVVDGCSKTYAMTGLRIGWAAGPRNVISAMARLQGQSTSCAATPSQHAAIAALDGDQTWVAEMVETFDVRRRFTVGRLRAIPGVTCFDPPGAFYAFPGFEAYVGRRLPDGTEIRDAFTISAHLLHDHGLVVVPGKPFGAPMHLRLSFATDMAALAKGLDRLHAALAAVI